MNYELSLLVFSCLFVSLSPCLLSPLHLVTLSPCHLVTLSPWGSRVRRGTMRRRIGSNEEVALTIRIVQVGMGGWGLGWGNLVCRSEDAELAAIVEMRPDALARARAELGLP